MRGRKRKGTRYFGPYAHAYAIRDTLDELLRSFPIRTCSPAKFRQHERLGRPCLLYHIEKCTGPCVGEIDEAPYRQLVDELCDFLDGDTDPIVKRLDAEMRAAADASWSSRRRPASATAWPPCAGPSSASRWSPTAARTSTSSASPRTSWRRRCRCSTCARAGSSGARGSSSTRSRTLTPGGLIDRILENLYGEDPPQGVPKQVLVPVDARRRRRPTRSGWRCSAARGCRSACPQRGDKRALLETVTRNAQEEFTRHRLRRASDHNTRSRALTELQEHLGLPEAPLRIECYDMAHLQGTDYVGSMVVLEDGLPNKREYRRFKVHVPGNDDYAAMEEVLTRRLTAYLAERDRPPLERGDKPGQVRLPAAAARRRRRQGPARRGRAGRARARAGAARSPSPAWPSGSRRCSCPAGRSRSRSRGGARRCSCCSGSATRPTASPTRSTASGAASG